MNKEKEKCQYEYDGKRCKGTGECYIRGLLVCNKHFYLLSDDNKYRAKNNIDIPVKSSEIKRKVAKILKEV